MKSGNKEAHTLIIYKKGEYMKIIKLAAMTCLSVFVVVNGVIPTATIADDRSGI